MLTKDDLQAIGELIKPLQEGQKQQRRQLDIIGLKVDTLQKQLETVDLKVENVHAYQQKAHEWLMEHITNISDVIWQELTKRIERREKHLGLEHS